MLNIAFYISNHGFGHASRNIPIIKKLLDYDDIKVFIKSGKEQIDFIKQSLKENLSRVALFHNELDIGLVLKRGSLSVDEEGLEKRLIEFIDSWPIRIQEEEVFLKNNNINLVVSDIVPWVFNVAKKAKVKSLFISNFSWVEIYKNYFDSSLCEKYLESYKLADKALLYKLFNDNITDYFYDYEYVGLSVRNFNLSKAEDIKKMFDKPIVFVSVGRSVDINNNINVQQLPYSFIVTEGIKLVGSNVRYLPKDTSNTHDYILASEFVITKAGWGTVAEVLCAGKPMAVIERNFIEEDRVTVSKLKAMKVAISITETELYDIGKVINKLSTFEYNENNIKFANDSNNIAKKIMHFARGDCYE